MAEKKNIRPRGPRDPVAGPDSGPEPPFPIKLSGPVIKGFGRGSRELGIPTANIPPTGLADHPDLTTGVYFGFVGLRLAPHTVQTADNSKLILSSSSSSSSNNVLSSSSSTSTRTASPSLPSSSSSPSPSPAPAPAPLALSSRHGEDEEDTTTTTTAPATTTTTTTTESNVTAESTSVYPAVLSIGYNPYYKNETRSIEIHILHHFPHYNFYYSPLNLLILGFIRPEYDYESLDALVTDIKTDCHVAKRSLERPNWKKWRQDDWLRAFGWVADGHGRGLADVKRLEAEVLGGAAAAAAAGGGGGGGGGGGDQEVAK